MKEIASRHNPRFKSWLSLLESKGLRREGLCLVSGPKIIQELSGSSIVEWLLPPKGAVPETKAPATRLASELFKELDVVGTKGPIAVVRYPELKKWSPEPPRGLEVIAALSDPQNVGALIRSSEAFGATRVILTRESGSPFLPRAIRASSGSVFRVPILSGPSVRDLAVDRSFGLDMEGQNIYGLAWPRDLYLIIGEEGQGLPGTLKATRIKIPMTKSIESLNAMAAATIALFSYRQRFPLP